jgi:hypothetical protein
MKWLGRALACHSWVEAETDLACTEPYWSLCFKLGLFRRTRRALRPLLHCVGSSDSLPAFRGRDGRNLHLATLVPSAPAGQTLHRWWRERSWRLDKRHKTGSALLRMASEGLRQRRVVPSSWPCHRASLHATQTLRDARNFNCCGSNSGRAATVPIRFRAL